jgi:hypothetical protein
MLIRGKQTSSGRMETSSCVRAHFKAKEDRRCGQRGKSKSLVITWLAVERRHDAKCPNREID